MISPWDLNIIGFLSFLLDDAHTVPPCEVLGFLLTLSGVLLGNAWL